LSAVASARIAGKLSLRQPKQSACAKHAGKIRKASPQKPNSNVNVKPEKEKQMPHDFDTDGSLGRAMAQSAIQDDVKEVKRQEVYIQQQINLLYNSFLNLKDGLSVSGTRQQHEFLEAWAVVMEKAFDDLDSQFGFVRPTKK
jgi:hypothetical protein